LAVGCDVRRGDFHLSISHLRIEESGKRIFLGTSLLSADGRDRPTATRDARGERREARGKFDVVN
jgi:hypothetical protein